METIIISLGGSLIVPDNVDVDILKKSTTIFNPSGSRKNTLIDCSVVVVAKKIKADAVFSYDGFYAKQGFKLAEDLIKKTISYPYFYDRDKDRAVFFINKDKKTERVIYPYNITKNVEK